MNIYAVSMTKKGDYKGPLADQKIIYQFEMALARGSVRDFTLLCMEFNPRSTYGKFAVCAPDEKIASLHRVSVEKYVDWTVQLCGHKLPKYKTMLEIARIFAVH